MNTNGFQALFCSKGGFAQIPWTRPAGKQFSVVVRFLPDMLPKEGTLFSLEDNWAVGFSQAGDSVGQGLSQATDSVGQNFSQEADSAGHIQVSGKGFCRRSAYAALPRCKNTVAAVCNGHDVEIYCNGVCAFKETLPNDPGSASCLRIGENLSAVCIFDVTIFHRALTPLEIRQCSVKKLTQFQKQILFCENEVPADVTLHQCGIENGVYALDCGEDGFFLPGVKLPQKHTISFSLYLSDENQKNGDLFQSSDFQARIFYERGCIAPQLIIHPAGCPEVNIPCGLKQNQWIHMTFVFAGSACRIYFDDMFVGSIDCESAKVQTRDITFGAFGGYMDTCTIVNYAVSDDQIKDFLQKPPGIFSRDLLYLCDFGGKELLESRHHIELHSFGARIVLLRGTDALTGVKKEIDAPESKRSYSDFVNWQIGVLIYLLVEWIHEQFGIYPNRGNIDMEKDPWEIETSLHQFIHRDILSMPEAQDLLFDYDAVSQEKLLCLIQAMEKNGTLKKLMAYLYQEDDDQDKLDDLIQEMLKAAMIVAVMLAIKTMLEGIKSIPKPPKHPDSPDSDDDDEDDDEDKKKKKTDVRIKQISLKGDMRIERGDISPLMASDQTAEGAEKTVTALFFKSKRSENPTLDVTISFRGDKDDFTVSAENKGGRVIAGGQKSISYSAASQASISLSVHPENFDGKYGKCKETLRWQCRSKDGKQSQFLGETDFTLYFLEGKPCGPWADTVPIECLALCADCAEHAGKSSAGFFEDYINYIKDRIEKQDCTAETTTSAKAYSRINHEKDKKSVFYVRDFARACRLGGLGITYNDRIYSAAIFSYLHGSVSVGTMGLCSGIIGTDENQSEYGARLLFLRDGMRDEGFCPEAYIHSVITMQGNPSGTAVLYDPLLRADGLSFSENPDSPVTGEYNACYYREGNYLHGTYCRQFFTLSKDDWKISGGSADPVREMDADNAESKPELPMVGLVGPGRLAGPEGDNYQHIGRTDFDPEIRDYIRRLRREDEKFNEACHSISACQIDNIIADICNRTVHHRRGNVSFHTLIEALYPNVGPGEDDLVERRHHLTQRLADTLERRLNAGNRDLYTDNMVLHFSYLAGNSPANLRMGRGDWNRSIQDHFDPERWFYFLEQASECIISELAIDEACMPGHLIQTLQRRYGEAPAIPPDQPGYYLADRKDGVRIAKLREMGYQADVIRKYVIDQADAGFVFYPLIASSGNRFPHEGGGGVRDRYIDPPEHLPPIPIFYISADEQGRHVWVRLV